MKAIIFDFGNVVGFFDHRRATRRLATYRNLDAELLYRQLFGGGLEDDYESGRLTTQEYLRGLRDLCGADCTDAELSLAYADIFWPNEEVCALLPLLKKKYRLVLGSNTNELHAVHFLKQFAEPLGHFHDLVLSYQIGSRKPLAPFFEECCRRAEVPSHACVFIDDLEANVAGARACGLHGIVYAKGMNLRGRLAELGIAVADTSR